jgi:phosphoadenosine phosphosulfate reductase
MVTSVLTSKAEVCTRTLELRKKPGLRSQVNENLFDKTLQKANAGIYQDFRIKQARKIIRIANKIFSGNLAVAFSGGKDSLVALHLTLTENPQISVIYNNTTVEFPETLQYVQKLQKDWNFELHKTKCDVPFLKTVQTRGWATHEDRWCCKPYKDNPARELLSKNNIDAEITGTTRTESIYRRSLKPFRLPKKAPQMIRINPIYDWNYWEVWRYIKENKLPYNPLYDKGYKRIGCWCCPINGWTHYRRLRKTHPRLYSFLERFKPKHPQLQNLEARLVS